MAARPKGRFVDSRRVQLRDYKSIAACDVELSPLTFLVGPNGSGKSNFLDGLRFVADSLYHSVEHAIRDRGGLKACLRQGHGRARSFSMRLDMLLEGKRPAYFAFQIGVRGGGFVVEHESCEVSALVGGKPRTFSYQAESGTLVGLKHLRGTDVMEISPSQDQFLLSGLLGGLPGFHEVRSALETMAFYRFDPAKIRELQPAGEGESLTRNGANAAVVLRDLAKKHPQVKVRIEEYLGSVVPGTIHVEPKSFGPRETLEFEERGGTRKSRRFLAASMSDGTLRALGILLALFQSPNGTRRVSFIGVEEPETALHPAAAGALLDALREASESRQVVVTSHSPDLLDEVNAESILAISAAEGVTSIAPINPAEREVLKQRLKTPGELLRSNHLTPDLRKVPKEQLRLF